MASILALLVALLLPALENAREMARRAACASQLHQIGLGHQQRGSDHFGKLVAGQPAYGPLLGIYPIWGKWGMRVVNSRYQEYGRFTGHGRLAQEGYIDPQSFYCPSWSYEPIRYQFHHKPTGQGGWWDPMSRVPAGQRWVQTSYHYRSSLPNRSGDGTFRPPHTSKDEGGTPIMADAFSDPRRGVGFHHQTGYTVLHLDGHTKFVRDEDHSIRDYNGGRTYHCCPWDMHEDVWKYDFRGKPELGSEQ